MLEEQAKTIKEQTMINERQSVTIDKQSTLIEELSITMKEMSGTVDKQSALIQQLQTETMVSFLYFDNVLLSEDIY